MSDRRTISVSINGETFEREVETRLTLADFIRHECLLTGTHVGPRGCQSTGIRDE